MIVYAKHLPYSDDHLARVIADMRRLGAPSLRCVRYRGHVIAIEGSHRLAAAHHLGLVPLLRLLPPDSSNSSSELDAFWDRALSSLIPWCFDVDDPYLR